MNKTPVTRLALATLLLAALAFASLSAFAADPEPVAPQKSGEAAEDQAELQNGRSNVQDLDVNKAELQEKGADALQMPKALPELKPMTVEIEAVLETSRVQVQNLQDRFDREPNAEAALALARQIEQVKIAAELDVLRIQARHAREKGDEELAQKLEAAVSQMTTPRPVKQPIERPASDVGNR